MYGLSFNKRTQGVRQNFGIAPLFFRAAHHDFGPDTMDLLAELEVLGQLPASYTIVDLSPDLIERQRAFTRQVFNQAVGQYNEALNQFPTRVLANLYGFKEARSL